MSLYAAMNTAISGLNATQTAINLTSRNVANVHSDGYTTKTVSFSALAHGGVSQGTINRKVSQALMAQARTEGNRLANVTTKANFLSAVANYLGTPSSGGGRLATKVQDLSDALQNLASTPSQNTNRTLLQSSAITMAHEIRDTSRQIQSQRQEADYEIGQAINDINKILAKIDEYNKSITRYLSLGQESTALDQMDLRDVELAKLSEYFSIKTYEGSTNGSIVVMMENGPILVDATVRYFSDYNSAGHVNAGMSWGTDVSAFDSISFADSPGVDLTTKFKDGILGALIELRDGTLPQYQAELDTMAAALRDELNEAHNLGVALPPQGTLTGTHAFGANTAVTDVTLSDDVQFALVDADGNATVIGGITAGTHSLDDVMLALNGALSAAGAGRAYFDASGHLVVEMTQDNFSLGFIETGDPAGTITNDFTGETVNGLSNFFGLNDFLVSNSAEGRTFQTTTVKSLSQTLNNVSFDFKDLNDTGAISVPPGGLSLGPFSGTLQSVVDQLNGALAGTDVTATIYRDGDGYAIRFEGTSTLHVTSTGSMGVTEYDLGASEQFFLNPRLEADPSQISTGILADDGSGNWALNIADGSAAAKMAEVFNTTYTFPNVSSMGGNMTIQTYLAQLIGHISGDSAAATLSVGDQQAILSSINEALSEYSGVDLDGELTNIIILQNAYSASARVISAVTSMMDTLFELV